MIFLISCRMLFSFPLWSINASVNRMLISPLGFLYSFSDQYRMKRDYKNTRMFNFNFDLCLYYKPLTCLKSFSPLLFRFFITAFS